MRVICKTQKTPEWYDARLGRVTASNMARAMKRLQKASGAKVKGDWSAEHDNYVEELAWEMVTRIPAEHYVSKAMEIGNQYESEARAEYIMATDADVSTTGFVLHPTLDYLGCSPDGIVYSSRKALPSDIAESAQVASLGGLEIKVPLLKTHQSYIVADVVPAEYIPQIQCNLLCTELDWWDFVSYAPPDIYPELPTQYRLFRKRVLPDPNVWQEMEEAATATMEQAIELANRIARINDRSREVA